MNIILQKASNLRDFSSDSGPKPAVDTRDVVENTIDLVKGDRGSSWESLVNSSRQFKPWNATDGLSDPLPSGDA